MNYEELKQSVDNYFSDRSRTADETRDGLETIRGEIEMLIESLTIDDSDDIGEGLADANSY